MKIDELIKKAQAASRSAIAPYSEFQVGAVVVTKDGRIFTGCNIENSSYGLTICAERLALFKALSEGARDFSHIVIVGDSERETYPCGACRQIISEFAPEATVVCGNMKGSFKTHSVEELIPHAFNDGDIK